VKKSQPTSVHRFVDMWAFPAMHPSNIELLQKLKTADTQHFNTHMDIVGTVSERAAGGWEKTHVVGLRTDVWRRDEAVLTQTLARVKAKRKKWLRSLIKKGGRLSRQQTQTLDESVANDEMMQLGWHDLERRRLVMKLFKTTGSRVRWCGTIEEVTTSEIHNSLGSRRNLISLVVMLPRNDYVTDIQQNHRTFRFPALFSAGFVDDNRVWHLVLKRHWISLGADFQIMADGRKIGKIDGKLVSFGADSHLKIDDHPLADDTQFVDMLTLFTASVGYHSAMRSSIGGRVKAVRAGQSYRHIIEDEELRLRHNGRAAA
jgi:hypothetical protein